jgi:hypothetical protein
MSYEHPKSGSQFTAAPIALAWISVFASPAPPCVSGSSSVMKPVKKGRLWTKAYAGVVDATRGMPYAMHGFLKATRRKRAPERPEWRKSRNKSERQVLADCGLPDPVLSTPCFRSR